MPVAPTPPRLRRRPRPPRAAVLAFVAILAATGRAAEAPLPQEVADAAWKDLALLSPALGRERIEAGGEELLTSSAGRDARLALATILLNDPPTTAEKIRRAETLATEILDGGRDDDTGLLAALLHARILSYHRDRPDPEAARAIYRDLLTRHPEHLVGQLAAVNLATLDLADVTVRDQARLATLAAEHGPRAFALSDASAPCNLHLLVGNTLLDRGGDLHLALRHLIAADERGVAAIAVRARTRAKIIVLARELGQPDLLRRYIPLFQREHPRDNRTHMFSLWLKELESSAP